MGRPSRRVPPEAYDKTYLLSDNTEGFREFKEGSLSFVKRSQLDLLELRPGLRLLEVGFGRGEFLKHCALRGVEVAGIDYSRDALEIARETMAEFPEADLRVADCGKLPFGSGEFDRVYSGDVIEHQPFEDGVEMLGEMLRSLRPGGLLLVHTSPNTVFTRGVLPVLKPLLRRIDAETLRSLEEHMRANAPHHVHEYNLLSLRKAARQAGLRGAEVWIGSDLLRSAQHRHTRAFSSHPLVRRVAGLGRLGAVRFFLGNDLYLRHRK
ncbi:MAG: class I SAM-dependent methyltransferase [Myxococcota bacterium]